MNFDEIFQFCPKCGSKHFNKNNEKSRKCDNCGFVYYMNPSSATAAFIINEKGELLVCRRGKEPEGIIREIKEETGLEIQECRYLFSVPNIYRYSGLDIPTLDMFYECKVPDGVEPKAADDAAECFWISPTDVHPELFGLRSIRHALNLYFGN